MARLEVHGLTRRPYFAGRDLVIEPGALVVLSGPTGSGKTLFLRAIADLDPVDAGEVRLDGTPASDIEPARWRRQVLYVHQAGVRLPGTVLENVAAVVGLGGAVAPVAATAPPGLDARAPAERLSGGEAQALALHRALLCAPRVLLLDESTSAMDPRTAAAWEARIVAFAAAGGSVLWVAHDPALSGRVGARREAFP